MENPFPLYAEYNSWMNEKLYTTAGELSPTELRENRGAFFGSIFGTLNHLLVADRIWLQRFAEHPNQFPALQWIRQLPKPTVLDEVLFDDFSSMKEHRKKMDATIQDWIASLSESDLNHVLQYSSMKGIPAAKPLRLVLLHFFNHQTHHRGQATTLLSQMGKDVGATDLLLLIPDQNGGR